MSCGQCQRRDQFVASVLGDRSNVRQSAGQQTTLVSERKQQTGPNADLGSPADLKKLFFEVGIPGAEMFHPSDNRRGGDTARMGSGWPMAHRGRSTPRSHRNEFGLWRHEPEIE